MVLWSALLHDINKRGTPIFDGRDHIHPFQSAREVLDIFQELGILHIHPDQEIN